MRRIVALVGLCLSTLFSWAQIKDIEIIAGPNIGMLRSSMINQSTETKLTFDSKIGYSMGIGSNYFFNEKFSLGARLLYQRTTVRGDFPFEYGNGKGNLELTTSFDYISLPIMARYTIGNKMKFSGEVGGFVNYLLNSNVSNYFVYNSMTPTYAEATGQYKNFDAGLSLGLSSQVPLSKKLSAKLSVYDNYGLVDISDIENPAIPNRQNKANYLRSNTVNLLAGIVYSLR
ncbi:MAG TPA: porin family protein [Cyclobacteriaceae bacterium]|nr:porin family protein [Cyclobacteriaceae bacterium]